MIFNNNRNRPKYNKNYDYKSLKSTYCRLTHVLGEKTTGLLRIATLPILENLYFTRVGLYFIPRENSVT